MRRLGDQNHIVKLDAMIIGLDRSVEAARANLVRARDAGKLGEIPGAHVQIAVCEQARATFMTVIAAIGLRIRVCQTPGCNNRFVTTGDNNRRIRCREHIPKEKA